MSSASLEPEQLSDSAAVSNTIVGMATLANSLMISPDGLGVDTSPPFPGGRLGAAREKRQTSAARLWTFRIGAPNLAPATYIQNDARFKTRR